MLELAATFAALRGRLRRRDGQAMVEAIIPLLYMLVVMIFIIYIFLFLVNALLAQNALTMTTLYVGSTGSWTAQQQTRCESLLPHTTTARGSCRVLKRGSTGNFDQVQTASCSGASTIKDCFNVSGSDRDISKYDAELMVEVKYPQRLPVLCLPGTTRCLVDGEKLVTRSMVTASQTRRRGS